MSVFRRGSVARGGGGRQGRDPVRVGLGRGEGEEALAGVGEQCGDHRADEGGDHVRQVGDQVGDAQHDQVVDALRHERHAEIAQGFVVHRAAGSGEGVQAVQHPGHQRRDHQRSRQRRPQGQAE